MRKTFEAILEADGTNLRWVVAHLPFDPVREWTERKGMRIRGTIRSGNNGSRRDDGEAGKFAFRSSLFGSRDGGYLILVNKQMQKGAGVTAGSLAEFTIEPDFEERSATAPPELARLLKEDRRVKKWYEQLNLSARQDISKSIQEPKSPEARVHRAEQVTERMMLAMEGERVLPPILQVAFRKHPKAQAGWEAMTQIQRRSSLLAIFYYQGVEARQKRVDKVVEEALKIAHRRQNAKTDRAEKR